MRRPRGAGAHATPRRRAAAEGVTLGPSEARGDPGLLEKYRNLCAKYEELVARSLAATHERVTDVSLALHAVRASTTGYAILRGGVLAGRNPRFAELARMLGWTAVDGGERYGTLPNLVLEKATEARRMGLHPGGRWHAGGGAATYELHLERVHARPPTIVATVVDVSDQVKAERELAAARQAMFDQERMRTVGELASGIAHDLNNTLHALSLRLERLRQSPSLVAEQGANLDALARIVADAAARIKRLQDLARTRADEPTQVVDVCRAISDAVEVIRPDLAADRRPGGSPVVVETSLREVPLVMGRADELRHVFLNLLVNARDAMPGGGRVRIEAEARGAAVVVRVADEGRGIAPDHLPRVFDPFFTTKGQRGTGLGLSIAAGVMRRLGGSIAVANRSGGGAEFKLSFPVAPEEMAARARDAARAEGQGHAEVTPRKLRVLVVDDDRDNLEATQLFLEGRCERVGSASSGAAALESLQRGERWDVVLCDIGMPDMNGWEAAARMRALAPGLPVFLLSGWAQEIGQDDPRRAQVAGILAKPLDMEALNAVLGDVARTAPGGPRAGPE